MIIFFLLINPIYIQDEMLIFRIDKVSHHEINSIFVGKNLKIIKIITFCCTFCEFLIQNCMNCLKYFNRIRSFQKLFHY